MDSETHTGNAEKNAGARVRALAGPIAVALAVVAFYWMHLDFGRMQTGGDFANLFWPLKEFRLRAMADAGAVPLWNPYVFMGSPLAATMQHAVFYPADYLFFWRSPTLAAMNLYVLAHCILAGIGTWWWMRRACGVSAWGAVCAGAAFPCTAWFWGAQEHINQVAAVAWMPWMLGTALLFARSAYAPRRFVAQYAGLGSMQFLSGHPQAAFYTHLAVFVVLVSARLAESKSLRSAAGALACLAAAGVLTGAVCAVQLLPTMELGDLSYRRFQHDDPAYSMTYSMPPDVLATIVSPHRFGNYVDGYADRRAYNEYGLYVGIPAMLLALGGAVVLARRRRFFALAMCAGGIALTLAMAMGGNASIARFASHDFSEFPVPAFGGGAMMQDVRAEDAESSGSILDLSLHEAFIAVVPPAAGFRVSARVLIVTALLWVTLAGVGLDGFLRLVRERSGARAAAAVAMLAIAASWLALYLPSRGEKFHHPKDTAPLLAEWERDRDLRAGASLDDRLYRLTTSDLDLIVAERQRSSEEEWEARFDGNGPSLRWLRWQENDNVTVLLPSVGGYEEGLSPTVRTKDFLFEINRNLRTYEPDGQLLALLGVGRIFADLPVSPEAFPPDESESRSIRAIRRVPSAKGAAFWSAQAEGIDFARLEGPFHRGGSPHGGRRDDPIEYGSAPNWDDDWPRIATDTTDPNKVVLTAAGHLPGDAILAMGWAPGWEAAGEPVEWLGAVHARVPEAAFVEGEAVLEYKPRSYRTGLFLTGIGLALWCCVATSGLARRGRRRLFSGA